MNSSLDPTVVCGQHGWWQACPDLDLSGYPPYGPDSANLNLILRQEPSDPISGSSPLRASTCEIAPGSERHYRDGHRLNVEQLVAQGGGVAIRQAIAPQPRPGSAVHFVDCRQHFLHRRGTWLVAGRIGAGELFSVRRTLAQPRLNGVDTIGAPRVVGDDGLGCDADLPQRYSDDDAPTRLRLPPVQRG